MRTKLILLLMGLILLPSVTAMYGGETEILYESDDCKQVFINLTNLEVPTNDTRYNLLPCTLLYTNYWECNCTDDKIKVNISLDVDGANIYYFDINRIYNYVSTGSEGVSSSSSSYSSGGSSSCKKDVEVKYLINGECKKVCKGYVSWYLNNGYIEGCGEEVDNRTKSIKDFDPMYSEDNINAESEEQQEEPKKGGIPTILWWAIGITTIGIILYFVFKQ